MTIIPAFDREADRLFGLTVEFRPDRAWHVMSGKQSLATCAGYEDATHERFAIIDRYLPKLDQIAINGLLRADRVHALRTELIRDYEAPARVAGHVPSLIVFEVEHEGALYRGQDYDTEENALIVLRANLKAGNVWSLLRRSADAAPVMAAE